MIQEVIFFKEKNYFSVYAALPSGDHLSAGKSAYSLTSCPLALISAACDSDGRVGLSWSTPLTRGMHASQLAGGQISVYQRALSAQGKLSFFFFSNPPHPYQNLYYTFFFPCPLFFSCYPGYRRRN